MLNQYEKIISGEEITFYNAKTRSLREYLRVDKSGLLIVWGGIFFLISAFMMVLITGLFEPQCFDEPVALIGLILFPIFSIIVLSTLLVVSIKGVIRDTNYFFELTANKQEISLRSRERQWSFSLVDIKKVKQKRRTDETPVYTPIFYVQIEGEVIEIEPFDSWFTSSTYFEPLMKSLCQHASIPLEDEFGNLVKIEDQS